MSFSNHLLSVVRPFVCLSDRPASVRPSDFFFKFLTSFPRGQTLTKHRTKHPNGKGILNCKKKAIFFFLNSFNSGPSILFPGRQTGYIALTVIPRNDSFCCIFIDFNVVYHKGMVIIV